MTGRRERKHEQTRQALLDALRFYVIDGHMALDALTVETISDRADVSARTFFRYFDTKAECALQACGIPRNAYRLPMDEGLTLDVDPLLLRRLVRDDPRFLGEAFVALTGGLRPRFVAAAESLDLLLAPAASGLGAGADLAATS